MFRFGNDTELYFHEYSDLLSIFQFNRIDPQAKFHGIPTGLDKNTRRQVEVIIIKLSDCLNAN